jgi:hypothetical protein
MDGGDFILKNIPHFYYKYLFKNLFKTLIAEYSAGSTSEHLSLTGK